MVKWWKGGLHVVGYLALTMCTVAAPPAAGSAGSTAVASVAKSYRLSRSGIPAFARKYSLACSACHTNWPELNAFGQAFKDRGYQLGNDRDSPIWQAPAYFPLALRTTPQWHSESTDNQPVDASPALQCNLTTGTNCVEKTITQSGFDLSGIDFLMLGTLYKNITFGLVPTLDPGGTMGIETAFVRFDNLFHSGWLNVKVGKFELDNLLSEKRIILLSNNGGFYQSYHFVPVNSTNDFGLGDNQLGAELMGHSTNSYTRYSVAVLGSVDGEPGLPTGKTYDMGFTLSHAIATGSLGLERLGLYAYYGQRATADETLGGVPIPGAGTNGKPFYRIGLTGNFSLGPLELLPFYMRGSDDKALIAGGTQDATWNSGLLEAHYIVNPQLVFLGRYEVIRMSQQGDPTTPNDQGNVDAATVGLRYYPIMFSRAGVALHGEFSHAKTIGRTPLSGDGVGADPLSPATAVSSNSLLLAIDFAF